ncbi:MAG: hypothetical protein IKS32_10795, partial [Solobacterium sp.]|nr:hypothetical protein [Solobacterium sp.]
LGVSQLQLSDVLCGVSNQRLYDTVNETKIGVYEIMDRKEVDYYFRNHSTSSSFITLRQRIKDALQAGLVDPSQASQDLA